MHISFDGGCDAVRKGMMRGVQMKVEKGSAVEKVLELKYKNAKVAKNPEQRLAVE